MLLSEGGNSGMKTFQYSIVYLMVLFYSNFLYVFLVLQIDVA